MQDLVDKEHKRLIGVHMIGNYSSGSIQLPL